MRTRRAASVTASARGRLSRSAMGWVDNVPMAAMPAYRGGSAGYSRMRTFTTVEFDRGGIAGVEAAHGGDEDCEEGLDGVVCGEEGDVRRPGERGRGSGCIEGGEFGGCEVEAACERRGRAAGASMGVGGGGREKKAVDDGSSPENDGKMSQDGGNIDSWCGLHLDHSMLTGLITVMYIDETNPSYPEVSRADPAIASALSTAGLYVKGRDGRFIQISIPADCVAFQLGEAAQIASRGRLVATPHLVRGAAVPGVARNTFAVFMQ
ncbi:hypothetical protein BDK51DRAFT_29953, partial [Blyttiomyces helicus]